VRTASRARRRRRVESALAVSAGLLGVACLFVAPVIGGSLQMPLLVFGAALIGSELLWLVQRAADERARIHADRIITAIEASRDAHRDAALDLAAAVCTVVDDLDQHTTRDAHLLRRELEDLLAAHPEPSRPPTAPTALLVPGRPEVDDPTAEVAAVTELTPAEPSDPGPLDAGWTWTPAPEREDANS
jgi:hypothetical protein